MRARGKRIFKIAAMIAVGVGVVILLKAYPDMQTPVLAILAMAVFCRFSVQIEDLQGDVAMVETRLDDMDELNETRWQQFERSREQQRTVIGGWSPLPEGK